MKTYTITIAMKDAQKAQDVFNFETGIGSGLTQIYKNIWETWYDEETFGPIQDDEYADECTLDYLEEVKEVLKEQHIGFEITEK